MTVKYMGRQRDLDNAAKNHDATLLPFNRWFYIKYNLPHPYTEKDAATDDLYDGLLVKRKGTVDFPFPQDTASSVAFETEDGSRWCYVSAESLTLQEPELWQS